MRVCKLVDFEKWVMRKKEVLEEGKAKLYTEFQKPKGLAFFNVLNLFV